MLYLFPYSFICLFCFNYIGFIEALSDSDFGQEFYFLSRWSLGVLSSISCLSAILETRCCPWQQANSFPVGQTLFCEFLSIFNISTILDSVVAHSNKNSISCMHWAPSVRSDIGLYSLYILYITVCCPWQQVLRCIHQSNSEALVTSLLLSQTIWVWEHIWALFHIYIYLFYWNLFLTTFLLNPKA